ncbi:FtsB family cell division protein [Candidatus Hydrogenosomobacter endosymbioticus]|uniref:Septum formation initiator n=1 Tax=Candidatus Hydrogenosomobacter endosymbioticus TaxID=2558174 RepID=A0ABN6L3D4_9PROT|nr:septum formation initiator family protein [Candidatus Hydrogenosomobacter endosymbioticus]BDB96397.1 hypothetical protein HYD_5300 [Candidatus Hydrogenosomobacter endosymbioticus]
MVIVFFAWMFCYFSYHAVYGKRGYIAWIEHKNRISEAKSELDLLSRQRAKLMDKISVMQDDIDKDSLEQLAWEQLRYIDNKKLVILLPGGKGKR